MENALFKYCFPKKCPAVNYCNKWNVIPKYYNEEISTLERTDYCEYKQAYLNYLESDQWHTIRNIVLMRAKHKCEKCGSREHLQTHHLNYNTVFNESLNDLILLCRNCHSRFHDKN